MLNIVPLKEVKVRKAADMVAHQIRGAIIRGELNSGDSLPAEADLITMFKVSRPTLREAVRILESENLVTVSRGSRGGARINRPSIEFISRTIGYTLQTQKAKLSDVYQARLMIEPPSAKLAALTRPKQAAAMLRQHVEDEFATLEDRSKTAAAVAEFHRLLVQESGNLTMALVASALFHLSEQHLSLVHRHFDLDEARSATLKRTQAGYRSHSKLVDLIEAGDGNGAEEHWAQHMREASNYWLQGFGGSGIDILD